MGFLSQKVEDILSKLGMIAAPFLYIWSVWQHENLFIWHSISINYNVANALPWDVWWNQPSQIFSYVVLTNGIVYDFTLLVGGLSFLLLAISLLYQNKKYETLKRRFDSLKKDGYKESV